MKNMTIMSAIVLNTVTALKGNTAIKPMTESHCVQMHPSLATTGTGVFKEYVKSVTALRDAVYANALRDQGAACSAKIADFISDMVGFKVSPNRYTVTRCAASATKRIGNTFEKGSIGSFRREIEIALFNTMVEFSYAEDASRNYFKASLALAKNESKEKELPGKIKALTAELSLYTAGTAEYKDCENRLANAKKSLEVVTDDDRKKKLTDEKDKAVKALESAVANGSASIVTRILAEKEQRVDEICRDVVTECINIAKAKTSKPAEKKVA